MPYVVFYHFTNARGESVSRWAVSYAETATEAAQGVLSTDQEEDEDGRDRYVDAVVVSESIGA